MEEIDLFEAIKRNKRKPKARHQARFWTTKEQYEKFISSCKENGVYIQDAFEGFINYYIRETEHRRSWNTATHAGRNEGKE